MTQFIHLPDQWDIKAESGKVDDQRLCINGRSAGGYTTLACLAFRNTFKAGASLYGVSCQLHTLSTVDSFSTGNFISIQGC